MYYLCPTNHNYMRYLTLLCFTLFTTLLSAQPDDYTSTLVNGIGVQYTLTGGTFPVYDTELEYVQRGNSYGLQRTSGTVDDQDFTRFINLDVPGGLLNRWNAAWNVTNKEVINMGDKVLMVVYLRHKPDVDSTKTGKVAIAIERNDNFDKEFDEIVEVNQEWQLYFIPMEISTRTHPIGGLTFGLQVGFFEQDIQIGGLAIINYGPNIPLSQLPRNLNTGNYGGNEPDAPWRAEAAARIEQLRKADMDITVVDANGEPMPNATVEVRMQQHEFKFGTAVRGSRFPGGRQYNATYVDRVFNLDGRGHGFNALVFENDLKWPGWEQEWVTVNPQLRNAINYLHERDIHLRGHVLLWPGWQNMPDRMQANRNNPDYLKQQVDNHIMTMLGEDEENFDTKVTDWDVLNEINTNTDLAAALAGTPGYTTGREFYVEVFNRARELAPDAELYINDYITLSLKNGPGNGLYEQYQDYIQELVDADAPIDGIGFQGHLGASPNSIYEVLETYDDFYNRFGLDAKITEFDLPRNVNSEVLPNYVRDFLTATFSHPSMTGFMFWNFWDNDTWRNPGANLYDQNWNEKPGHAAFTGLVFDEWWTDADLTTDAAGTTSLRGFKGRYEITATCGTTPVTATVDLSEDNSFVIDCATLMVSNDEPALPAGALQASPNPGAGPLQLTNTLPFQLRSVLYDAGGREVWSGRLAHGSTSLSLDLPAGVYTLRYTDGQAAGALRLVRQ